MRSARTLVVEGAIALLAIGLVAWAVLADLGWFERHVYPGYCTTSRAHEVWPWIARGAAILVAALLVLLVRPRLGRWAARARALDVAAIAGAIAAAVVVSELILRRHSVGEVTPLVRKDMPRAVADGRLGWRFVPSQTVSPLVRGRRVAYAIDAEGNRARSAAARIDPARPTIVVAGESIAFGESLPWDDTFAAHLAADLERQVMNIGVPAYGSDQAFLRTVDALARLRRPVAVVTVFVPQLIRRTGQTRRPHLVLEDGRLVPAPADSPLALAGLWRDEPYHGDRALELTRAILAASVRLARDHGAVPLFVVTNIGDPCKADAWLLRTLFDEPAIPYVRVTLGPGETIGEGDPHPNALGARKLAAAIEARLAR